MAITTPAAVTIAGKMTAVSVEAIIPKSIFKYPSQQFSRPLTDQPNPDC